MDWLLGTAGIICLGLGLGHATIGFRWVLPTLTGDRLAATPIGGASMTAGMLRFSWHIVTVMLFGFAALLMTLSVATGVQPTTIVLRWVSAQWAVASLLAFWQIRRRPGSLLRLPVPLFFPVLAALCWAASL